MRKSTLIKHLDQLGEEELRAEIIKLYEQYSDVKDYYTMELGSAKQRAQRYARTKERLQSKFTSKSRRRVRRPRIAQARRILSEIEIHTVFPHELIDVYLFACEVAIAFGTRYQFSSPALDNFLRDYFQKAVKLIREEQLEEQYGKRSDEVRFNLPNDLNL